MVSQKLLQELQTIIKEDYGRDLNEDLVSEIGNGLVDLFEFLVKHRSLIPSNSQGDSQHKNKAFRQ